MAKLILELVILTIGMCLISGDDCPQKCICNDDAFSCDGLDGAEFGSILEGLTPPRQGFILNNFRVAYIPANMFDKMSFIKNLAITDSVDIMTMDENVFRGLNEIESILIGGTSINDLPEKIFQPVRKTLKYLEIIDNEITQLHEHTFMGMEVLQTIDLTGNPLTLPLTAVFRHPSLNRTKIVLKENNISCEPCTPALADMVALVNNENYSIEAECKSKPSNGIKLIKDLKCEKVINPSTTAKPLITTTEPKSTKPSRRTTTEKEASTKTSQKISTGTPKPTNPANAAGDICPLKCSCDQQAVSCDSITSQELLNVFATINPSARNKTFILINFLSTEITSGMFDAILNVKHLTITDSPSVVLIDENALQGLHNIESIMIHATSIADLPENLFKPVGKTLRFLELTNNEFMSLYNKTFMDLGILQILDLTGNPLRIPQVAVFSYPNLKRTAIRLKDNNISCDPCTRSLAEMGLLIHVQNYSITVECTAPINYAGKMLEDLRQDDLNCDDILAKLLNYEQTTAKLTTETTTGTEAKLIFVRPTTKPETTTKKITTTSPTTTSLPTTTTVPTTAEVLTTTVVPTVVPTSTVVPTTTVLPTSTAVPTTVLASTTAIPTTTKLHTTTELPTTTIAKTKSTQAPKVTEPTTTKIEITTKPPKSDCPHKCTCEAERVECKQISEKALAKITMLTNKNVKVLALKELKIKKIGADFLKDIPNVSQISITESPEIQSIDENAFRSLRSCKSVTIMGTMISDLPDKLFSPVAGQLQYLDLMNNKIVTLSKVIFKDMTELQTIDLSGNPLKLPSNETFAYPALSKTTIRLHSNNISCEPCMPPIEGLLNLINKLNYPISIECNHPEKFHGIFLEKISGANLNCSAGEVSSSDFNYGWLIIAIAVVLAGLVIFGIVREFKQHKYKRIKDRENDFFSLNDDGPETMADMYDDPYDELPLLEVNANLRKSINENSKLVKI